MCIRDRLRGLRNTTDFEYENSISQVNRHVYEEVETVFLITSPHLAPISSTIIRELHKYCLLYTSDAADERSSVDLGGRRIIKKKKYIYKALIINI